MRVQCAQLWSLLIVVKNGTLSRLAGGIGLHCEYFHPLIYSLAVFLFFNNLSCHRAQTKAGRYKHLPRSHPIAKLNN